MCCWSDADTLKRYSAAGSTDTRTGWRNVAGPVGAFACSGGFLVCCSRGFSIGVFGMHSVAPLGCSRDESECFRFTPAALAAEVEDKDVVGKGSSARVVASVLFKDT